MHYLICPTYITQNLLEATIIKLHTDFNNEKLCFIFAFFLLIHVLQLCGLQNHHVYKNRIT